MTQTKKTTKVDDRVVPALEVLASLIRKSGVTHASIDKALGKDKLMAGLISGRAAPRLDTILDVLEVLGIDPGTFWVTVYPDAVGKKLNHLLEMEAKLMEMVERPGL